MNPASTTSSESMCSERQVLVTGGTSGIGLAIARGFARAGDRVLAAGLEPPPEAEVNVEFIELDVTDERAVAKALGRLDRLDVLVNAAGVIARDKEFELATFRRVLDINLTGAMCVSTCALAKLSERGGGAVVNVASMLSFFGGKRVPAYAASKGGIVQLTKSLAIAWADVGVRVNAIAPGWIETPMTDALRSDAARSQSILGRTPLARWGRPEELVGPVMFLASADASFVTGAILNVDGGYACV